MTLFKSKYVTSTQGITLIKEMRVSSEPSDKIELKSTIL